MTDGPSFELDPIRRLRVLAAAIPGAAVVEATLDAQFADVWAVATDFERVSEIEVFVAEPRIRTRHADPDTGAERLAVGYRPRVLGGEDVLDIDLRPGWCWMQSRLSIAGLAARPEGSRTRFAHLEALRIPGGRLLGPLLGAKMAVVRELRRIETRAQKRAPPPG